MMAYYRSRVAPGTYREDLTMTTTTDNLRTFQYRAGGKLPTFSQALNWHDMMKEPSATFLKKRQPATKTFLASDYLREIWDGLMGTVDLDDEVTCMPSCVDFTIPPRYVAVVRRQGGTPAAFAYCEIVKQVTAAKDLTDDYEIRQRMEEAWKAFDKRANEANKVSEGYGCDNSQSWMTLRDIGKEPDSEKLKAKMLAIAELAGRMYDMFGVQHREHPNEDPEEVIGATVGPDIDRILSSELALLADEDCEDPQTMKILEGRATMTEMAGKEQKSRGPLVLAIDESGSMHDGDLGGMWSSGPLWNGRNTWAKACAVALTRIAWGENRPVRAVHFGRSTVAQDIPKDDHRAIFEMARSFLSGGTAFGAALKRGRALVGDLEADGFAGADIVLITDGEDHDHRSHNRELDHMDRDGVKLWTVAIGDDIPGQSPVRSRCEKYTYAADRDLSRKDTAAKLAHGLDKAAMGNDPDASGHLN